ncbi:hypothetical protein DID88_003859 [Monilinia fructigena]|uniref:Suppressor of forked domain-containing protein n=1 Tax=Monilinia fructigena TaxID=38457 RepID=A0A395IUV3_9HELO|nr:hypothetical protein DID88_003859 [Monilinia fructigena]
MADFQYGGTDEESAEIKKLNAEVLEDTDNFESWEKLVRAAETLEGGLNRNSSPQAIATTRDSYDRFLAKFPLLFGYWKKYADLEFSIAGTEAAEMVFERGIASIATSVDLWTDYCSFKVETSHDPDVIRELFERGAVAVGLDFLAHPFWDKYLEFEDRVEAQDKIFAILNRVVKIPMHQYARYFERFRQLAHARPLTELLPAETLEQFRADVVSESAGFQAGPKGELEIERDIRTKVDNFHLEIFARTQQRLLSVGLTCAFYDEFWFRYARWMSSKERKEEEVRNIYQRASTLYVPISRPGIRLQYAYFEEMSGRVDVARDIHQAILDRMPGHVETIISWANLERRQKGLEAAIEVYKAQIDSPAVDIYSKAAFVAEWAALLWKIRGSVDEARQVFQKNKQWYLKAVISGPKSEHYERLKQIHGDMIKTNMRLETKKDISNLYLTYLQERGTKEAMKEFLQIDRELNGPISVQPDHVKTAESGKTTENGAIPGAVDAVSLLKGEVRYNTYFQQPKQQLPGDAQGLASFH